MKIAMFGHKRIPSREGGIEIVVEELAVRMIQKRHQVVCLNRGVQGKKRTASQYNGIDLDTVPTIDKKGLAAVTSSFFAALKTAIGKYDIVHIHAEGPAAFCWIPKLCGKRIICTVHGLDWAREKWGHGFASKYILFGEKMAVKYADEIIVLSHNIQNYFKETYGRETRFISNGVSRPNNRMADLIEKQFSLHKDEYILFLGRIVPEKGLRYLIQAYQSMNIDKKLVIAGASSNTDGFYQELKRMAADNPNIIFTGFVQGALLEELFSNAYVYVLPSDLEGMPLSLLEAMSYGNCCLTSDIEECAEVICDKGVTFKRANVQDLISQLQFLCEHKEIVDEYKRNACEYICNKYSWDLVVEKTLDLYSGRGEK